MIKADGKGLRRNQGKTRFALFPPDALWSIAEVFTFGSVKYEPRNWERGMSWSTCYDSLQRHMHQWWAGERYCSDSGLPHLAHAGCNILFLLAYELRGLTKFDDRQKVRPLGEVSKRKARRVRK